MNIQAPKTLLAVRLPNWVGDVVMALPTLLQLQRGGFTLKAVGRDWAKDLLAGMDIDVATSNRGVVSTCRVLRELRASQGLLFTNSISSAVTMRLAGIQALGYRTDGRGLLLHKSLPKGSGMHEVEYFWRLGAAAAGCWSTKLQHWPAVPPASIELRLSDSHRTSAAHALNERKVHGSYVVCCPMAAGESRRGPKKWPLFPELSRALASAGHQIVACPGPGEERACLESLPGAVIIPGLSLGAYAAVLQGAERVIANDSGPMHLAAAVGAPVLGIFGGGDPQRTRPWGGYYVGGSQGWPSFATVRSAVDALPLRRVA